MSTARELHPTLENGAVMTREEFHREYEKCPELHRVELIEGVVYLPSPIKVEHAQPQGVMILWLETYALSRPDVECVPPATVILDDANELEPDAMLIRTTPGWVNDDGYVARAPDLIVEIANSSRSRDLHPKKRAYERNGVREYIVWRARDKAIDWFELQDGTYVPREPDRAGRIESRAFPGLVMDVEAMLKMDRKRVLAALKP